MFLLSLAGRERSKICVMHSNSIPLFEKQKENGITINFIGIGDLLISYLTSSSHLVNDIFQWHYSISHNVWKGSFFKKNCNSLVGWRRLGVVVVV